MYLGLASLIYTGSHKKYCFYSRKYIFNSRNDYALGLASLIYTGSHKKYCFYSRKYIFNSRNDYALGLASLAHSEIGGMGDVSPI